MSNSKSTIRVLMTLSAIAVCSPSLVVGQTPEAQPSESQLLSSAPEPGSSAASVTLGFQLKDGRTETLTEQELGLLSHHSEFPRIVRFPIE